MSNGKFICVQSVSSLMEVGKVYEFKNGCVTYENGSKGANYGSIEEYHAHNIAFKLEPYKEYLTISELKEGKQYKCLNEGYEKCVYELDEESYLLVRRKDVFEGYARATLSVKEFDEMQFKEINPNRERIEKLYILKQEAEQAIRNFERDIKEQDELIIKYNDKLKELEG